MNQQVKYMLLTYESFIIHSLIIIFIIQPSPSNKKNHHKQTCDRATFEVIFCEKIVVRMKNVKFRGKKMNSMVKFRGSIRRKKTQIPRLGAKFRGPRKTVGPIHERLSGEKTKLLTTLHLLTNSVDLCSVRLSA